MALLVGVPVGVLVVALLAPLVFANEHAVRTPLLAEYRSECSSCHIAYPPKLLPAASWRRLMGSLDRHFGTDASLDARSARLIGDWLEQQSASRWSERAAPPEDRITRSAWFVREHGEVPTGAWQRKAVGSAANCAACHAGAERGSFSEHDVRIPR